MITNLNKFRKTFENWSNEPKPNIIQGKDDLNILKFYIDKIVSLMNQTDDEIKADFIKGLELYGADGKDVAATYTQDEQSMQRMYDEWRRDCKFAIDNIGEFVDGCGPKTDEIFNNIDSLKHAIVGYANDGDPLEFIKESLAQLPHEKEFQSLQNEFGKHAVKMMFPSGLRGYIDSRTKGNYSVDAIKQNLKTQNAPKINEANTQTQTSLPNITTTEQLHAHIMQGVQKAMDIFTSQQKISKITVSVQGEYLRGLSEVFVEDDLGVFKNGVKQAQIQISNSSKLVISEGLFSQAVWGTLSLRYEILSGGSNGVEYNFTENNSNNQFIYDIVENKFYTVKDYHSKTEKRTAGYNTKRIK